MTATLMPRWSQEDMPPNVVLAAGAGLDSAKLVLFPLQLPQLGPYGHWELLIARFKDRTVTTECPTDVWGGFWLVSTYCEYFLISSFFPGV